ncbi:MAG: potassium channel protein [Spirulina sp. SIO3F2]|nr:potassium channel protein [Spirulina sp. SIO3F2]
MNPKIIVCGLGRTGYQIFHLLRQQGADAIGISDRPVPGEKGSDIIIGDLHSNATLMNAGLHHAQALVLASNDDALNLEILTRARMINPRVRIINRIFNYTLGERLDHTLVNHVSMSASRLAAPIFTFAAQGNKATGQLELFGQTWPIHEEIIDPDHPWLGHKLSSLWENRRRMLIYYLSAREEGNLMEALHHDKCLEVGDRLIVGDEPTIQARRYVRVKKLLTTFANLRKFHHYGRSVALVMLALLVTIFVATATYISTNFDTSPVDALYFSVGMITGAGGQEEVAEMAPDAIKVFTAIMMIVGAGVIGICYALINDFILGSRLRQFWAAAQVPRHNHYIVCGLGGVGFRIVQQLCRQGERVVVIESNAKNRFIHAARSLGVPVIIEDAAMATTLRSAHLAGAAALITVTSNDMVNVEIALCAKGISAKIPVVVRNHDAQFALSVQQVFEFETVLCPTELATPAFAAAALGGRILGNGITDELLWVALATLITPRHPFCDRLVRDIAETADFVPLYLERSGKKYHGWFLLETVLRPNDVLYLTMPAMGLEQLWRQSSDTTLPFSLSP